MMTTRKPHITRTYAPIHFEDLDPHRFEDLVRELIYDFKEWQTIEATGRSGSDDGFDIRAFEKARRTVAVSDDETEDEVQPMDGRRWMVQGKREKTITPYGVKKIFDDVNEDDPPYGYILAASTVFSKKSYDVFRDVLRRKGVLEFYLWGNAELEDMLHLPKNDRILFTFFGVSLVSRRRSRTTELRATVNIKNKLYKLLGSADSDFSTTVLLRDTNDTRYPFEREYPDFDRDPRWVEREAFEHHPFHSSKFFAYVDRAKKEWDFTDSANLLIRHLHRDEEFEEKNRKAIRDIKKITDYLPRALNGDFHIDCVVRYEDIALVDSEGDGYYKCPHLFLDFSQSPYRGTLERLSVNREKFRLTDEWRRINHFKNATPIELRPPVAGDTRAIDLDPETLRAHFKYEKDAETLYAIDDRFANLALGDVIPLRTEHEGKPQYLRVTHIQRSTLTEYLRHSPEAWQARRFAARQIGRDVADTDLLKIVEVDRVHPSQWENIDS